MSNACNRFVPRVDRRDATAQSGEDVQTRDEQVTRSRLCLLYASQVSST